MLQNNNNNNNNKKKNHLNQNKKNEQNEQIFIYVPPTCHIGECSSTSDELPRKLNGVQFMRSLSMF